jgi:hypothetical protein
MNCAPLLPALMFAVLADSACAAPQADPQLLGRWCSAEVTLRKGDGTRTSNKSNASQYMVQTFSRDRVVVEWVRLPQWARWTQSYAIVAPGQVSMKMLEHSSLPTLIGSRSLFHYETRGDNLKLVTEPEQKHEPIVETTWTRCPE